MKVCLEKKIKVCLKKDVYVWEKVKVEEKMKVCVEGSCSWVENRYLNDCQLSSNKDFLLVVVIVFQMYNCSQQRVESVEREKV